MRHRENSWNVNRHEPPDELEDDEEEQALDNESDVRGRTGVIQPEKPTAFR